MAIDMLPLTLQNPEDGRYVELPLHFLPEYHAREAARFGGYGWAEFDALAPDTATGVVAHYIAQRMFAAHEADAIRLSQEAEAKRGARN